MMVSVVALLVLGLAASVQSQGTIQCHAICDCLQTPDGLALLCSGRDLKQLPSFELLPGFDASAITELYLNDNGISTLGRNNFQGMPNLRILSVARNNLTRWRADTFEGLYRLELLSIEDNPIDTIDPDDSLDFPNLKEFVMTNHRVQQIPRNMFPESIEIIRLDNGHLNEMPFLGVHPKLTLLTAKNNRIWSLRRNWFIGIPQPKAGGSFLIDLNGNPVWFIDREFIRPQNMQPTCRPEFVDDMKGDSLFWFEMRIGNSNVTNPCELNYWVNFLSPRSQYPNYVDPHSSFLASGEMLLGYFRGRCRDNWICDTPVLPTANGAIRPATTPFGALLVAFAALVTYLARK